ncbi:hypothetical protein [Prauserella endophytica]|uniref:Secreted protein n=1 Tax=Prauserella endophytica TaxID=1592324 RepID=A0ABY2S0B5_9PSEU|nr:hypothetical protein [Prauserella endophytica]TKG67531.1 hypothetical protein FCN18_22480 [Prauserella endophytica]
MAKQQLPLMPKTGSGVLTKLIGTVAVLALVVVIVRHPGDAAAWAKGMGGVITGIVDGVAAFFRQLAG